MREKEAHKQNVEQSCEEGGAKVSCHRAAVLAALCWCGPPAGPPEQGQVSLCLFSLHSPSCFGCRLQGAGRNQCSQAHGGVLPASWGCCSTVSGTGSSGEPLLESGLGEKWGRGLSCRRRVSLPLHLLPSSQGYLPGRNPWAHHRSPNKPASFSLQYRISVSADRAGSSVCILYKLAFLKQSPCCFGEGARYLWLSGGLRHWSESCLSSFPARNPFSAQDSTHQSCHLACPCARTVAILKGRIS